MIKGIALKVFIGIALTVTAASASTGIVMNKYFKVDKKNGNETSFSFNKPYTMDELCKKQGIDYPWVKNGNFSIKTTVDTIDEEGNDIKAEIGEVFTYDVENKSIVPQAVCAGELTLSATFDPSISFSFRFETQFNDNAFEMMLKEQYESFFTDKVVSKGELALVDRIHFKNKNVINCVDFFGLPNLEVVTINNENDITEITNNNTPSNVKFYIPGEKYNEYLALNCWKNIDDRVFPIKSSYSNAVVMLFKEGGTLDNTSDRNYEYYEIPIGERFTDIPTEENIHTIGNYFKGWKDKDGNLYDKTTIIEGDVKLHANWELKDYKINYHLNDKNDRITTKSGYKYQDNLVIESMSLTDDDYLFEGWDDSPEARTVKYRTNDRIDNFFDDSFLEFDLYAVWVHKTIKIQYYNGNDPIEGQLYEYSYGNTIHLPDIPGLGGFLIGFSKTADQRVVDYEKDKTLTVKYDEGNEYIYLVKDKNSENNVINLYCILEQTYYKISYYNEDGSKTLYEQDLVDFDDPTQGYLAHNSVIRIKSDRDFSNEDTDKKGYHFVGWARLYGEEVELFTAFESNEFDNSYFTKIYYLQNENDKLFTIDPVLNENSEDMELYPYFEANDFSLKYPDNSTASLIYDQQSFKHPYSFGRTGKEVSSITAKNTKGESISLGTNTSFGPVTVHNLYSLGFQGSGFERHSDVYKGTPIVLTIEATYTPIQFTVTFMSRGSQHAKQIVNYGEKASQPSNPSNYEDSDYYYTFSYWKDSVGNKWSFSNGIYANTTLYAQFSAEEKSKCFLAGTTVTLSNGSKKPIEEVTLGEELKSWNFVTGEYSTAIVSFVHHQTMEATLISMDFANGKQVNIVTEDSLFDTTTMEVVDVKPDTIAQRVGHKFLFDNLETSELINVTISKGHYEFCGITPYKALCYYANDALAFGTHVAPFVNFATINDDFKYDEELLQQDIETYGLMTYEEAGLEIPIEIFEAYNVQFLPIIIGKGYLTQEQLAALIELFKESQTWQ